ncbi:MAG: NTP transferase domain-containing protein [Bacteroidales bacterium]|nr:NTP transferase domain-containing protein [Bacteroidales bacterium]
MGGIYTCLKHSVNEINIVLSCDIPYMSEQVIDALLIHHKMADFIVPETKTGSLEPLCAIYKKQLIPVLSKMIESQDYSVKNLSNYCPTKKLRISEELGFNDQVFFHNVNTEKRFPHQNFTKFHK